MRHTGYGDPTRCPRHGQTLPGTECSASGFSKGCQPLAAYRKIHNVLYRTEPGPICSMYGILWHMSTKPQPSIDAERAKKLAVELSVLLRQQLEALEDSAYILMDEEKVEAYEQRSKRIAE